MKSEELCYPILSGNEHGPYVDIDSLIDQGIDDALGVLMKKQVSDVEGGGGLEALGTTIGAGLIGMMKDPIKAYVKAEIQKQFAHADQHSNVKPKMHKENDIAKKVDGSLEKYKEALSERKMKLAYLKVNGNIANLGISFFDKEIKKTLVMDLKMERTNQWRVNHVTNLASLIQETEEAQQKMVDDYNKPIVNRLKDLIAVTNSRIQIGGRSQWSKKLSISAEVTTQSPLQSFKGDITLSDTSGEVLYALAVSESKVRKSETISVNKSLNPFKEADKAMLDRAGTLETLSVDLNVTEATLQNGERFKIIENFSELKLLKDNQSNSH